MISMDPELLLLNSLVDNINHKKWIMFVFQKQFLLLLLRSLKSDLKVKKFYLIKYGREFIEHELSLE